MRVVLIAALALLGACTAPEGLAPGAQPPAAEAPAAVISLDGTSWRRVDDLDANPHGGTIAFEGARASGSTGCNRWFGDVTINGPALSFGQVGMTRMACAAPAMAAEQRFTAMLSQVRGYRLQDATTLVLLDAGGAEVARFTVE